MTTRGPDVWIGLDLGTNAVRHEINGATEHFGSLGGDWSQAELFFWCTLGLAEMADQNN